MRHTTNLHNSIYTSTVSLPHAPESWLAAYIPQLGGRKRDTKVITISSTVFITWTLTTFKNSCWSNRIQGRLLCLTHLLVQSYYMLYYVFRGRGLKTMDKLYFEFILNWSPYLHFQNVWHIISSITYFEK